MTTKFSGTKLIKYPIPRVTNAASIVGFDGIHAAFWSGYELTTIRQPVNQMAKAAVNILMERIENPDTPPEKRVLAGSLINGTSAKSWNQNLEQAP